MHSTKVFLSMAALAGISLSQSSDSQYCSDYVSSLFGNAPTIPADITSFLASESATQTAPPATTPTSDVLPDPIGHAEFLCELAAELPSSLLPEFKTYASDLLGYGKDHSSDYLAYITNCFTGKVAASMSSYVQSVFTATGNLCQTTLPVTPSSAPTGSGFFKCP
ncbi:hypothetical protein F4678DRAFT_475096 [Xylaria arbuscula]|nr:hypothetical protein F4678DRAFT_475096 [Xylaria arbuscula]